MKEKMYSIGNDYTTIDDYFRMARNNYIEDPKELEQISTILKRRRRNEQADYINFIKDDIINKKIFEDDHVDGEKYYSVSQIKRDYVDYEGKNGSEEKCFFENGDRRIDVYCIFEFDRITTVMEITDYETGSHGNTAFSLDWEEFKNLSQKDFEYQLNEAVFYYNPEESEAA